MYVYFYIVNPFFSQIFGLVSYHRGALSNDRHKVLIISSRNEVIISSMGLCEERDRIRERSPRGGGERAKLTGLR